MLYAEHAARAHSDRSSVPVLLGVDERCGRAVAPLPPAGQRSHDRQAPDRRLLRATRVPAPDAGHPAGGQTDPLQRGPLHQLFRLALVRTSATPDQSLKPAGGKTIELLLTPME